MTAHKGETAWAPCFHDEDAEQQTQAYVRAVLAKPPTMAVSEKVPVTLNGLLWVLAEAWYYEGQAREVADFKWGFYGDQWVGVSVEVHRENAEPEYLWTEADSFLLALAKSIERLKDRGYFVAPPAEEEEQQEEPAGKISSGG